MKHVGIYNFFDFLKFNKKLKYIEEKLPNPVEALKLPREEEKHDLKRKYEPKCENEPKKKLATIKFHL